MFDFLLLIEDPLKREKLSDLVYKYNDDLVKYARSWLWRRKHRNYETEGEDVVQNAYSKLIKYIDKINFDEDEENLRRYMYVIVRNEAVNFIKDVQIVESFDETMYVENNINEIMSMLEEKNVLDEVALALTELNDTYSIPIALYYSYGHSVKDISQIIGVPEGTVYTRMERGIKKLREMLGLGGNT